MAANSEWLDKVNEIIGYDPTTLEFTDTTIGKDDPTDLYGINNGIAGNTNYTKEDAKNDSTEINTTTTADRLGLTDIVKSVEETISNYSEYFKYVIYFLIFVLILKILD